MSDDSDPLERPDLTGLRGRVDPYLTGVFEESAELGFLGGMPISEQIEHALGFALLLEANLGGPPTSAIDLGSGGGVPGLVLMSCWPRTRLVLMDASERRTRFLAAAVEGWPGEVAGEVVRGRAEELGRQDDMRESFAVATSRSFGIPAATAECGAAFLSVGGLMVVSEPPGADPSGRWPAEGLHALGLVPVPADRPDPRYGYQLLRKEQPLSDRYPRRVGIPVKRPAF